MRASEQSPGYNLYVDAVIDLRPLESKYISTGWLITIPRETFGRIISKRPNNPLFSIGSEILESESQIPLVVFVSNKTEQTITFQQGEEIAYLMIDRVVPIIMTEQMRPYIGIECVSRYILQSLQTGNSILGDSAEYIKSINHQHAFDQSLELSSHITPISNQQSKDFIEYNQQILPESQEKCNQSCCYQDAQTQTIFLKDIFLKNRRYSFIHHAVFMGLMLKKDSHPTFVYHQFTYQLFNIYN